VGIQQWHAQSAARVERDMQAVSPIGRIRRLPAGGSFDDKAFGHAVRQAINSPVQGFASDLMQIAAASIAGVMPHHAPVREAHLVATVHDSIVATVPCENAVEVIEACIDRMVNGTVDVLARMGVTLAVPLVADVTVGTRWGLSDVDLSAAIDQAGAA
jgi:DNA polymerase I-like protein with 3'-5' exonuclease and polymerase domains